ncbi:hypothetical protein IAD21_05642 [Abditibacteriota bacterium]|nr:hypothetical protein IAD21_05642 [Abditibacteriota bacterium]
MRRFLIFPALFAAWFSAAQFGIRILQEFSYWFIFHNLLSSIQFHLEPLVLYSVRVGGIGIFIGCLFALLDLLINRNQREVYETTQHLLKNLLISGVVAVSLVLFCQVIWISILIKHPRRYQISPTASTLLDWLGYIPPLLLLAALLWATVKTLWKPATSESHLQ